MPYELKQQSPRLFFVVNTETGRKFSKRPIYRKKALAQMRILRQAEEHRAKGGEIPDLNAIGDLSDEEGGAFFDSLKSLFSGFTQKAKDVAQGVKTIASGNIVRQALAPSQDEFFQLHKNDKVIQLEVCRNPIQQAVGTALNVLSAGKWNDAVRKLGYDKIFHLQIRGQLQGGIPFSLEKVDVVRLTSPPVALPSDTQVMQVPMNNSNITLGDLFTMTQAKFGSNSFWTYSPFSQNCQQFVYNVLSGVGLMNSELMKFVKANDAEAMAREGTNMLSRGISNFATKSASFFRTLTGSGLEEKPKTHVMPDGTIMQGEMHGSGFLEDIGRIVAPIATVVAPEVAIPAQIFSSMFH